MKKVYNKIEEVMQLWINQTQSEARCRNVFFKDNIIYSYGSHYPLAVIYNNVILINKDSYSITTQKHKYLIKRAIKYTKYIEVINPCNPLDLENLKNLKNEIKLIHNRYKKAILNKNNYYIASIEAINNYRKFKKIFYNFNKQNLNPSTLTLNLIEKNNQLLLADREKRRIEGVLIPKDLFKNYCKKTLTPEKILKCKNAEVRSVLLKSYGYGRLLNHFDHKTIDKDIKKDYELTLLITPKTEIIKDFQGNITRQLPEDIMLIKVKDSSTGTFYVLRVPTTVNTCQEALAWTFGMSKEEYNLEVEA